METQTAPCETCPWRVSLRGRRHQLGWYRKENLRRLWTGLRTGRAPGMTCHETDDDVLRPDDWPPLPEGVEKLACAGVALCIQRELQLFEAAAGNVADYRRASGRLALTAGALSYWIARVMFGGTPLADGPAPNRVPECDDIGRPEGRPAPPPGQCACIATSCDCRGACTGARFTRKGASRWCADCQAWRSREATAHA